MDTLHGVWTEYTEYEVDGILCPLLCFSLRYHIINSSCMLWTIHLTLCS